MSEVLSTCEKDFVMRCLIGNKRLDGRSFTEFRNVTINFGSEWGCVFVSLGETKVLAQVACEVTQPRATRPTEGDLFINVNFGQEKRSSEPMVLLTRMLERAFKESRCVDLESLCIKAEEKVWKVRVDLNVLNHEGNLVDCASIAVLAALAHFKRPDVTMNGTEITIHTHNERDPIPLVLHHYPVCVSYAIFKNGEISIADPSLMEERRSEANIVFGLNSYRELCGLHFGGMTLASPQLLIKCASQGAKRANAVVQLVQRTLEEDSRKRSENLPVGFMECLMADTFDSHAEDRLTLKLRHFKFDPTAEEQDELLARMKTEQIEIKSMGKQSAVLLPAEEYTDPTGSPKWIPDDDDFDGFDDGSQFVAENERKSKKNKGAKQKKQPKASKQPKEEAMSTDSEEEETVVLESGEQFK